MSVRVIAAPPARAPRTQGELSILEQAHAAYDLYLWFSLRCPEAFPEHDLAQSLRQTCAAAIELGLQRSASSKLRGGATDADASRLERAKAAVRSETAKLEAAGFGNDSDEDDAFGSVTFSPPRARKPEGESSEPTARGEGDEGDEDGGRRRESRVARGEREQPRPERERARRRRSEESRGAEDDADDDSDDESSSFEETETETESERERSASRARRAQADAGGERGGEGEGRRAARANRAVGIRRATGRTRRRGSAFARWRRPERRRVTSIDETYSRERRRSKDVESSRHARPTRVENTFTFALAVPRSWCGGFRALDSA